MQFVTLEWCIFIHFFDLHRLFLWLCRPFLSNICYSFMAEKIPNTFFKILISTRKENRKFNYNTVQPEMAIKTVAFHWKQQRKKPIPWFISTNRNRKVSWSDGKHLYKCDMNAMNRLHCAVYFVDILNTEKGKACQPTTPFHSSAVNVLSLVSIWLVSLYI